MASCRPIPRDAPTMMATGFLESILSSSSRVFLQSKVHLYEILSTSIGRYRCKIARGPQVTADCTRSCHYLTHVKELHS